MALFDGSFKRRKEISLRGASKQEQRDVVQRAAAGRAERELLRKQTVAATNIQRFFRRCSALRRFRQQVRSNFDAEADLMASAEGCTREGMRLVAFYSAKRDGERLVRLCTALVTHAPVLLASPSPSLIQTWQLVLLCCLRDSGQGTSHTPALVALMPQLVAAADALVPADAWLVWLCRHGGFGYLSRAVAAERLADVQLLLVRCMQARDDILVLGLATEVLSVVPPSPSITHFWTTQLRPDIVAGFMTRLSAASERLLDLPQDAAAGLLCHLIDLSFHHLDGAARDVVLAFLRVMQVLLRRAPVLEMIADARRASGVVGSSSGRVGVGVGGGGGAAAAVADDSDDDEERTQVCPPNASPMMARLFGRLLSVLDNQGVLHVYIRCLHAGSVDDGVAAVVCSLLAQLLGMPLAAKTRADLLFSIAFRQPGVVAGLWRRWLSRDLRPSYDILADTGRLRHGVHVFAEACSHALLTLDDQELVSPDWFTPKELVDLVHCFTRVVVDLCDSSKHHKSDVLEAPICKLLHRLHCRNVRMRFCAPGDWQPSTLPPAMCSAALAAITADDLEDDDPDDRTSAGRGGGVMASERDSSRRDLVRGQVLRLLRQVPFVFPFEERVRLFRMLVESTRDGGFGHFGGIGLNINREQLYEDAYAQLAPVGSAFRGRTRVSFHKDGLREAGVDGGGLFREFLTELIKETFGPKLGTFTSTPTNTIFPNPRAQLARPDFLKHMHFAGMVLAKALHEGMLLEVPFASFFLLKLLAEKPDFNDLESLDPELHRNLLVLKRCEEPEDLGLYFSVTEEWAGGTMRHVELFPGGKDVAVTAANRLLYLHLVADYHLNRRIRLHCGEFCRGLFQIIPQTWLRLFASDELQKLIGGEEAHIDVEDFRRHVVYGGEYHDQHQAIQMFWRVLQTLSQEELRNLLKFITSVPRPPLLGFRYFHPLICIQSAGHEARLPTASTCMNLFKLPVFTDEATMRKHLLYAINSGSGFDLS